MATSTILECPRGCPIWVKPFDTDYYICPTCNTGFCNLCKHDHFRGDCIDPPLPVLKSTKSFEAHKVIAQY